MTAKPSTHILAALLLLLPLTAEARLTVTKVMTNYSAALVATAAPPHAGWQMTSDTQNDRQTAYRIRIFDTATGKKTADTGKVKSSRSQRVPLSVGEGMYEWQVMVWDKNGKPSPWSTRTQFVMQTAKTAFGKAQWIGAITKQDAHTPEGRIYHGNQLKQTRHLWDRADTLSRRSIYLKGTFRTRRKVRCAMMNVCGLGFNEVRIDGRKVGDSEFAPLWSDYDRSVFYNTYDVTEMIGTGETSVEVLLGNGFYNEQGGRYHKLRISFGPPTLLMRLHIVYDDGTTDDIVTDKTWQYSLSEITLNSIYGGEDYDARIPRRWKPVVVQQPPKGVLRPQQAPPVKVMRRYKPVACKLLTPEECRKAEPVAKHDIPDGTFVLDMGQNMAGVPEITVTGRRGQKVTIYVAETLTPEGACNQRQTGRLHSYSYIIKGEGKETYRPRFAYYGFRYIQVEGARLDNELAQRLKADTKTAGKAEEMPTVTDITACFVHNSAEKVSSFECSNALVNRTHEIIGNAVRSNMQSVFTDCPHREKLGWLEQDWLNGIGLFSNYDLTTFAPQLEQVIADAQYASGAVPTTAPEYVVFHGPGMDAFAESPEWGGTIVMLPWMYRQFYDDDTLIRRFYPNMVRYVDYLATQDSCGILNQGLGDWYDYGDFRSGFSRNTSVPLVATAHHYRWTLLVSRMAEMTGHEADAARLRKKAEDIRAAWQKAYGVRKTNDGRWDGELLRSQTGMAIALNLRLVEDGQRNAVLDSLTADIQRHGNRLTTGDVGNRYLFETLAEEGKQELLYTMLNHYDVPGYGYQISKGMTTLTEQWDPAHGSSMNHFMMGQIDGLHFTSLAGINVSGSHVVFRPQPVADIKWVKAATQTPYGKVAIEWRRTDNGKLKTHVEVPVGMTYDIIDE